MGERLLCKQEVVGSIPSASTSSAGVEARVGLLEIRRKETQHGNVRLAAETRWSGIMDSVKTIVK